MKIKVRNYSINKKDKNDVKLSIQMDVESCDTISNTGVIIQMSKLAYFVPRIDLKISSLLYLSAIIYSIDRTFDRSKYSVDGWSRDFNVEIKLPGADIFEKNKEAINRLLSFLTGDFWNCSYEECNSVKVPKYKDSKLFDGIEQVNLFSGGLDSLIGAIDYLSANTSKKIFLASHYDSYMHGPSNDQKLLLSELNTKYPNRIITLPNQHSIMITPHISEDTTCRSRSFMFVSIALMIASYKNVDICIPENGSVSLNYPLSASRRSSCSTRTTHPIVVDKLNELFNLMGISTKVYNPYKLNTKGEMIKECLDINFLTSIIDKSNSCGKRGHPVNFIDDHKASHCGRCMPCMYRKASLLSIKDKTTYGVKFLTLFNMKNNRKSKLADDFLAMLNFLKRDLSDEDIKKELRIAGMKNIDDINEYTLLVHKTRTELTDLVLKDGNIKIINYINK